MLLGKSQVLDLCRNGYILNSVLDRVSKDEGGNKILSYGVSYAGYDVRLGNRFLVYKCCDSGVIVYKTKFVIAGKTLDAVSILRSMCTNHYFDPLTNNGGQEKDHRYMFTVPDGYVLALAPGVTVLCETVEDFCMPSNVMGIVLGKSTYARAGLLVNATPLEPGWKGKLVIEVTNLNTVGIFLYPGQGIAQVVLHEIGEESEYVGNYQNQTGFESMGVTKVLELLPRDNGDDSGRWNWWGIESKNIPVSE